jgi:hypothetical protein
MTVIEMIVSAALAIVPALIIIPLFKGLGGVMGAIANKASGIAGKPMGQAMAGVKSNAAKRSDLAKGVAANVKKNTPIFGSKDANARRSRIANTTFGKGLDKISMGYYSGGAANAAAKQEAEDIEFAKNAATSEMVDKSMDPGKVGTDGLYSEDTQHGYLQRKLMTATEKGDRAGIKAYTDMLAAKGVAGRSAVVSAVGVADSKMAKETDEGKKKKYAASRQALNNHIQSDFAGWKESDSRAINMTKGKGSVLMGADELTDSDIAGHSEDDMKTILGNDGSDESKLAMAQRAQAILNNDTIKKDGKKRQALADIMKEGGLGMGGDSSPVTALNNVANSGDQQSGGSAPDGSSGGGAGATQSDTGHLVKTTRSAIDSRSGNVVEVARAGREVMQQVHAASGETGQTTKNTLRAGMKKLSNEDISKIIQHGVANTNDVHAQELLKIARSEAERRNRSN